MSGRSKALLRPRWGDGVACLALMILAAGLWLTLFPPQSTAVSAVVLRDGVEIVRLDLRGMEERDYSPEEGVVIRYGRGKAAFLQSDCPDQVCVRTGWLTRPGQSAVCLPKRLVLQLEGEGELDAISG